LLQLDTLIKSYFSLKQYYVFCRRKSHILIYKSYIIEDRVLNIQLPMCKSFLFKFGEKNSMIGKVHFLSVVINQPYYDRDGIMLTINLWKYRCLKNLSMKYASKRFKGMLSSYCVCVYKLLFEKKINLLFNKQWKRDKKNVFSFDKKRE